MPTLTVFTPTYNRAHTLPRLFHSLQRQSSRDFVWLVIDDGSVDDTRALMQDYQRSADFPVQYIYQRNRGKHGAHNVAVARAATALFAIVDSDDELLPHAVETLTSVWQNMDAAEKSRIGGIWTLCEDANGNIVGGPFPRAVFDASLQDLRYKHRINKEMLPTFVTDVLRAHPFPETPAGVCPYIPESYVWMRITRTQPLRFLNAVCRVYHPGEDGLLAMGTNEYRLSRCIVFGYLAPLANDLRWFWSYPQLFLLNSIQAARYAIFSRQFWKLSAPLSYFARLLLVCAAPIALALLARDSLTGRIERQLKNSRGGNAAEGHSTSAPPARPD